LKTFVLAGTITFEATMNFDLNYVTKSAARPGWKVVDTVGVVAAVDTEVGVEK
jgi:hypothetical protein